MFTGAICQKKTVNGRKTSNNLNDFNLFYISETTKQ